MGCNPILEHHCRVVIAKCRIRVCLHQASSLRQLCNDASDSVLIDINGDA